MNRRTSILVVAVLAAALVGVALLAIPGSPIKQSPTLGLDLQGGLEVTLQAVPPPDRELTAEDLERSVDIMRNRVDKLGVTEPEIRTQGDDQITIQLPGVKDPAAAAEIIGTTAQLELYDLETSLTGPSISIQGEPVENPSAVRPAVAGAGAGARANRTRTTSSTRRRSVSSAARSARGQEALREVRREAAGGPRAVRGAAEHGRHHVRRAAPSSAPAARRERCAAGPDVLLPLQVRAARRSRR